MSKKRNPCTVCGGSGEVAAVGGWVTQYDTDRCSHCGGSVQEPKNETTSKPQRPQFELSKRGSEDPKNSR